MVAAGVVVTLAAAAPGAATGVAHQAGGVAPGPPAGVGDDGEREGAPLAVVLLVAVQSDDDAALDDLLDLAAAVETPLSIALAPAPEGSPADTSDPTDDTAPDSSTTATSSPAAGTAPPRLATALGGDELFSLPATSLDPSALVAVGESALFTRALRRGEDRLSAASPSATVSRAVWLADRPVSTPAVTLLRDLGVRLLILDDSVAVSLGVDPGAGIVGVALDSATSLPAMTVSPLGELLAAGGGTDATADERAERLLEELRVARRAGAAAVVLGAPDLAVLDTEATAAFAALVDVAADVAIVPASQLPGVAERALAPDATTVPLPATVGADLTARRAVIEDVRRRAGHAAAMSPDANAGTRWQRQLDALLSSAITDEDAISRTAAIEAEVDAVLTAIVPPEPFTFTMTGSSNTLRIPLGNTSAEPLRVDVLVHSPKLAIDDPLQSVEVPALSVLEVDVPVRARSNGTFTIEVDVLAPDGHRLGSPVVLKGRVSQVTGLSQVVTGGAVLVLASWWYTHLRRRRLARMRAVDPLLEPLPEPGATRAGGP